MGRPFRIGLISDTHGKLSETAEHALAGVDAIVHAGDIGAPVVLYDLMAIAPLTAVLGNTDHDDYGFDLNPVALVRLADVRTWVVHDLRHAGPVPEGVRLVVHGHTHRPEVDQQDGVLFVNPGSASRSRGYGHTVAIAAIDDAGSIGVEIVEV